MLVVYAILTCLMITVILNDVTRFLIPNWLVLALIAVYPVAVIVSAAHPDWKIACGVAFAAFVVLATLYFLKLFGAGDAKLLAATTLYTGKEVLLDYIVVVALSGGALALFLLAIRPLAKRFYDARGKASSLPRVLTPGEKFVPYGVAIAGAFLYMLWSNRLPGLAI
jgi:prepilin peptidase CpaA